MGKKAAINPIQRIRTEGRSGHGDRLASGVQSPSSARRVGLLDPGGLRSLAAARTIGRWLSHNDWTDGPGQATCPAVTE